MPELGNLFLMAALLIAGIGSAAFVYYLPAGSQKYPEPLRGHAGSLWHTGDQGENCTRYSFQSSDLERFMGDAFVSRWFGRGIRSTNRGRTAVDGSKWNT